MDVLPVGRGWTEGPFVKALVANLPQFLSRPLQVDEHM